MTKYGESLSPVKINQSSRSMAKEAVTEVKKLGNESSFLSSDSVSEIVGALKSQEHVLMNRIVACTLDNDTESLQQLLTLEPEIDLPSIRTQEGFSLLHLAV